MSKTTKKTIVACISQNTGVSLGAAKRALETVLQSIKRALGDGKQVDLGRLGRLSVVARPPQNRISKNLKHVGPTINRLHKKHPKTVRLTKRQDLSENPQPTVVTKSISEGSGRPVLARRVRVAVAFPSWRRRIRYKEK